MAMLRKLLATAALVAAVPAFAAPILWVGDSRGQLGTVDVATGNAIVIGNMAHVMVDIAFDSAGTLWGTDGGSLYTINAGTAASTLVGAMGIGFTNSLVFGANGTLYTVGSSLFSLNTSTGAGTLIGGGGGYSSSGDIAFVGGHLYLSSGPTANDSLWEINVTTGAGTNIGAINFGAVYGLATPDNTTLFGLSGQTVLSINTSTGAGTAVVSYGNGLGAAFGTAFRTEAGGPNDIPEPSVLALLAAAAAAAGLSRRKQA